ncbi:C40 family peptidase [Wenjunlia tyrosinilytica]|uniref:NlpC/P60 domain-containing protein n=1 Tax=Wenjunlia tyrosinilytica TaxID=1544741 RepID=A0A917ZHR0_9ACTN|nr:C40 family peptidase [Wenjunlia tyrosinilytica]GGO83448.1 hypothetical protein GCM10012280_12470 [Wenjunlia tyrosinilytica]
MASHRKPKRPLTASGSRTTAATLALAGAATATVLSQPGSAAPRPSAEQAGKRVTDLYRQAERMTEKYNGAKEKRDRAQRRVNDLQDEIARRTDRMGDVRRHLGAIAAAQYREGGTLDPSARLALSSDPGQYLERAGLVDRITRAQARTLRGYVHARRALERDRAEAADLLDELDGARDRVAEHRRAVGAKLHEAQRLLDGLDPSQRAELAAADGMTAPRRARTDRGEQSRDAVFRAMDLPAPSSRAAAAVAFARAALGKPYVWGATGPNAFDCSGLTQSAWRAAGVSLPRTTYTQINTGHRIPRSGLRPGDLVFFYSGISHVGLYIGDGRMIHAPHPGAPVRVAPIDQMPFAGAARPV